MNCKKIHSSPHYTWQLNGCSGNGKPDITWGKKNEIKWDENTSFLPFKLYTYWQYWNLTGRYLRAWAMHPGFQSFPLLSHSWSSKWVCVQILCCVMKTALLWQLLMHSKLKKKIDELVSKPSKLIAGRHHFPSHLWCQNCRRSLMCKVVGLQVLSVHLQPFSIFVCTLRSP